MRFRLLQARLPNDIVRAEERRSFASRLGVPETDITPYDLLTEPLSVERVTADVDIVLIGGSGAFGVTNNTPWMRPFIDLTAALADSGFPTFASCFGFQAMIVGLGGTVRPDPDTAEVGSFDLQLTEAGKADPLFATLGPEFTAQEGHKDRAIDLPKALVHLASSARTPYQAIRVPGKPVYATQFHPELIWTENRERFMRYYDLYEGAFGKDEALAISRAFRPSEKSNDLLRRFAQSIA